MELIKSTSSPEDTLANLSPSQVEKKVKKIRDTSGQKCLDLSENSDLLGSLEKTLVDTLNSVSTPYSRTWRVKATPQGRLVFQLLASVPTTKEKGSGLWATPQTTDGTRAHQIRRPDELSDKAKKGGCANLREQVMWRTPDAVSGGSNLPGIQRALDSGHLKRPSGQPIQNRLHYQVREPRLWPTAQARDWKGSSGRSYKGLERDLPTAVKQSILMWPTPTRCNDSFYVDNSPNKEKRHSRGLASEVDHRAKTAMLPTPTVQDSKNNGGPSQQKRNTKPLNAVAGGTLNPTWVEWLMGYPKGWTDLNV